MNRVVAWSVTTQIRRSANLAARSSGTAGRVEASLVSPANTLPMMFQPFASAERDVLQSVIRLGRDAGGLGSA